MREQDFTSYEVTQTQPHTLKEIGADNKVCLFNESTYINEAFRDAVKPYLEKHYPKTEVTLKHIDRATDLFSEHRKPTFSLTSKERSPFPFELSDNPNDFKDGEVEIPWWVRGIFGKSYRSHV